MCVLRATGTRNYIYVDEEHGYFEPSHPDGYVPAEPDPMYYGVHQPPEMFVHAWSR